MTEGSGLSARQQELLARELARRRSAVVPQIRPRPEGEPPALSQAQQRLWFLDRVTPGQSVYNATLTMRLDGPLDEGALRHALVEVVRRHEALRTVAVDVGGSPQGRLVDPVVDWRAQVIDEADLDEALSGDAREPFDLSRDVLLRPRLYRLGPDRHVLILVLHHIACDGWSRGVLFDELAEVYNATMQGRPVRLPELPIQYGDYARWQLQHAQAQAGRSDDFWRSELAGANVVLDLPTDFPRRSRPDHVGTRVAMPGPPDSADALRALARSERATYFMASLAVTGVLLASVCDCDDVVVGSPVANRGHPGLEGLIGFFVNTVILRVRLAGDPTFREVLRRCRSAALGSLGHQDTPLEHVVELVNPRRVPGVNPLFQVNFRMQGAAPRPPQLHGLSVSRLFTDTGAARFDLAVGVNDEPGALRGYVEYAARLFRPSTAWAFQATFADLVTQVTADPDQRLPALRPRVQEWFAAHRAGQESQAGPRPASIRASIRPGPRRGGTA